MADPSPADGRRIRVVIVDDSEPLCGLLATMLAGAGCEVVGVAYDGHEAIGVARATKPDVVVMDLHMPGLDGLQALQRIRAADPQVSIIMFTSGAPRDVDACLAAGAERHFTKQDIHGLVAHLSQRGQNGQISGTHSTATMPKSASIGSPKRQ